MEPFKIQPGELFYDKWEHRVSPKHYIAMRYKEMAGYVNDNRNHKDALLKYLIEKGAILLESDVTITNEEDEMEDASPLSKLMFGDENGTYRLFLYKDNLISMEGEERIGIYYPISKPCVHSEFEQFVEPAKGAKVSVLLQTQNGLTTRSIDFEPPTIADLGLNYGAAFPAIHDQIVAKLKAKKAGLFLFNGPPGGGKSFYIKHLTSIIDREFIFVPIGLAAELASPSFLTVLLNHKEAIIVLEDAEQALQSRDVDNYNAATVSTLLNLADGVLGQILNITVLASYNTDKQNIDSALLRKGRLSFSHTFGNLSIEDAKRVAAHLKKEIKITQPTSLADIYNAEDNTNYREPERKIMGFGVKG